MPETSRRRALQVSALTMAAAALPATALPAGADGPRPGRRPNRRPDRIDTHHHAVPDEMRRWAIEHKLIEEDKLPPWAEWTLEDALDLMDDNGIAAGVASAPIPAEAFKDKRELAISGIKVCNESMAGLVRDTPTRFGFFANVAMLFPDLAVQQIGHALDDLGADGILLNTSADGKYLGDPMFEPIFAELDRRRAVVFTHPLQPKGIVDVPHIDEWVVDFLADTTRTALSLIAAGTLERYRHMSVILSHAGGYLPYMLGRAERWGRLKGSPTTDEKVRRAMRRFYYDTALPMSPYATPTLLGIVGADRVLFGTDWPAISAEDVLRGTEAYELDPVLDERARRAIDNGNARRLFPRLAARIGR
ncbi:amidohydrolase family protein [Actinomadura spongiicola]|nr:amidohydrolase family protein [Actinomadura spongiicola]